jgi:MinD-like ATPase involved in chromosome partitioning or flagellar assembly
VTYLLAAASARASKAPVLAIDCGGTSAGLSAYAETRAPRSLEAAIQRLDQSAALDGGLFGVGRFGLRLICSDPCVASDRRLAISATSRLLRDARAAHGVTFVDCGTVATALERTALESASHVVWILPATVSGVARARLALERMPRTTTGNQQVVVARHDASGARSSLQDLDLLAEARGAGLALMPQVPDVIEHGVDAALGAVEDVLESMMRLLLR